MKNSSRKQNNRKKVFVAMSGGVDSSVAAYLLQKQGYDVTGVYMKNWSEESLGGKFSKYCPWRRDLADVRKVGRILKIPVKVYNFEKEYNKKVIDYFFQGELKGETPNPDVICNREIKFGLFLKKALTDGADLIATGHYARLRQTKTPKGLIYQIVKAKDENKDQSYFLCLLSQKQLRYSLFPLGEYTKPEVRNIAKRLRFPNADKEESMGICFVGEVKLEEFLKARIKERPGNIVTVEGKVVGRHKGLPFYTIGQRRGIEVGGGVPYYVVAKDMKKNLLIVAAGSRSPELFSKKILLRSINWIAGFPPKLPLRCWARIRYRQQLQKAIVKKTKMGLLVEFASPQRAVTPGQFCALYKRGVLLGGGEIK